MALRILTLGEIITQLQTQWEAPNEGAHYHWADTSVFYHVLTEPPAPTNSGASNGVGLDTNILTIQKETKAIIAFEIWDDLIAINLISSDDENSDITFGYSSTTTNGDTYAPLWTTGSNPDFELTQERWSRLSEQIFRVDKWSLCRG